MHIDTCIQQYGKIQVAFMYVLYKYFLASIFGPQTNNLKKNPKYHSLCFFEIIINACK
jgi:hypothetical protein